MNARAHPSPAAQALTAAAARRAPLKSAVAGLVLHAAARPGAPDSLRIIARQIKARQGTTTPQVFTTATKEHPDGI